jgi:predicted porin
MPLMDGGQRWNNSITYNSPNFSGFDLMAIYSFGENVSRSKVNKDDSNCSNRNASLTNGTTPSNFADNANRKCADSTDGGRLGLGVRYANGPLYLAAAYHVRFDNDSSKADPSVNTRALNAGFGAKGWGLGGSYDFKVVKVYANYFRVKANHGGIANGVDAGVARRDVGSDKQTAWSLGIGVPVSGAGTVVAEYAQYKDYYGGIANARVSDEGDNTYPNYLAGRDAGHKAKGYTIGYKHVMSKRTSLYTYATRINNDRGINAGWDKTGVAGEDQTIFTAGILHTF